MELDIERLGMDEARLFISSHRDDPPNGNATLLLYSLSSDCISCPYSRVAVLEPGGNASVRINAARSVTWRVYDDEALAESQPPEYRSAEDVSGLICQLRPNLGEYGIYELIESNGTEAAPRGCDFRTILEPRNSYAPLAAALGVVLSLILALWLAKKWWLTTRMAATGRTSRTETGSTPNETAARGPRRSRRILSIDTFRGISILTMIFVNNGAGGYVRLEHATWNGLFIGDLVFPCFIWIMGVCIPIALSSQLARGASRSSITLAILKRSLLLFLIDLSTNSIGTDADLKRIRIFGVLQRFAVAYAVVGISYVYLVRRIKKGRGDESHHRAPPPPPVDDEKTMPGKFADVGSLSAQWMLILGLTGLHTAITFCLPVPGCPTGYLGPGGRHAEGRYASCTGGASGYVDRMILGKNHLYERPTIDLVYGSGPFEPEGILGCLTTILSTFLGVQTGETLRTFDEWKSRVSRCLILAIVCGTLGCGLHFTDTVPINKNLWSLSFVLSTSSFALCLFVVSYLLVDVGRLWSGGPFRIPGMNALVMYVGHRMCDRIFPFHWKYGDGNPPVTSHEERTIAALWDAAAWTILAYLLHRKRIYISL